MINYDLLEAIIREKGFKKGHIARVIGVDPNTLTKKLAGANDFKIAEVSAICKELKLTSVERDNIFFAN